MEKQNSELKEKSALSEKEKIEKIVLELSSQGLTSEKIGLVLRDTYGIPKVKLYGKKISRILKENKLEPKSDVFNLQARVDKLEKQIEKNKHDYKTKRILSIKKAKLRKLNIYKSRLS